MVPIRNVFLTNLCGFIYGIVVNRSPLCFRSAEFPVDNTFDGNLEDLLKSGSRDEPMIFFK